jgi:hypothetical protein
MEWEFNTGSGALYLIGTGPMDDYLGIQAPWTAYSNQIRHIYADSRSQYTSIGKYAFFNYMNLESVELPNTVEGMVSIRLMDNDYYVFHEDKYELVGERTGKVYRLGDKVHIAVMNTDKLTRTIDFRFVKPMEEAWE